MITCSRSDRGALLLALLPAAVRAADPGAIASAAREAGGVKIHYLSAGKGPALILLHGYAETFTDVAADHPEARRAVHRDRARSAGNRRLGDSELAIDMAWAAARVHDLARSLGVQTAEVVGHDIGLMVAYAYAAKYPSEVTKLALMDAFLPGVEGWEAIYDNPDLWHFRFHGETPARLVAGREAEYFAYYWNEFAADRNRSLPAADREAYVAAYSRPGRMRPAGRTSPRFRRPPPISPSSRRRSSAFPCSRSGVRSRSARRSAGRRGSSPTTPPSSF
jgi:pimeloyl-ACP methyl ester carboxylesterase